jgi:hypothetical protein
MAQLLMAKNPLNVPALAGVVSAIMGYVAKIGAEQGIVEAQQ